MRNDITIKTDNALLDLSLFLHKKIKGYINRFTNPINRREVLLDLTDKALNLINDFDNYMESMLCENFKNISIDDKKNLLLASSFIKNLIEENPIQY